VDQIWLEISARSGSVFNGNQQTAASGVHKKAGRKIGLPLGEQTGCLFVSPGVSLVSTVENLTEQEGSGEFWASWSRDGRESVAG